MDRTRNADMIDRGAFVEGLAAVFEEMGVPLIAGRIFGWLLVCTPPEQSAAELSEAVSASRGSVSTMTRLLMRVGLVERIAMPGQRSRFYRVKPGGTLELLNAKMRVTTVMRQLADRGLAAMSHETPETRARMQEFRDMYAFFEREFPLIIDKWRNELAGDL